MLRITTILIFLAGSILNAQLFSVYNVKTDNFPLMKANFLLLDDQGYPINNVNDSDFKVIDNYIDVSHTVRTNCWEQEEILPQKIILVLDISGSMEFVDQNGETYWSWVKEGVTTFINAVRFEEGKEVAIITFNSQAQLLCNFTNQPDTLLYAIDRIQLGGGTNYDSAFMDIDDGVYGIFQNISDDYKKICVFLTDGYPNDPPNTIEIIQKMLEQHIQVFSITVNSPMNYSLENISKQTGGVSFEIFDKTTLNRIYDLIATFTNSKQICELTWISDTDCNQFTPLRILDITYLPTDSRRYIFYETNEKKIAKLVPDKPILKFNNIDLGEDTITTITLSAINSDFIIDSIIINGTNEIFIKDTLEYPIKIDENETFQFSIKYVNTRLNYINEANILVLSEPCMANINVMTGNYSLDLISPNGGELFSVCDVVPIIWNKCNVDDKIDIYYRKDTISQWKLIDTLVNGLKYNWYVEYDPLIFGDNEVEVQIKFSDSVQKFWNLNIGNENEQFVSDFALSPTDKHLFLAGNFEGEFDSGRKFISHGDLDGFIMKYDLAGNYIHSVQIGSKGRDSIAAIYYDKEQDLIYVTGYCHNKLMYEDILIDPVLGYSCSQFFLPEYHKLMFILKLTPNLILKDYMIGPEEIYCNFPNNNFRVFDINISNQNIFLYGKFFGRLNIFDNTFFCDTAWTDFEATFDKDFNLTFFRVKETPDSLKNKFNITDDNKISYNLINYEDTLYINGDRYISNGKKDILVLKTLKYNEVKDQSDSLFKIIDPTFVKQIDTLNLGTIIPGEQKEVKFKNILKNVDLLPMNINFIQITGENSDFFYFDDFGKTTVDVNDSLDIKIGCFTDDFGVYEALLTVDIDCAGLAFYRIIANSECQTEHIDSIFIASIPYNTTAEKTFKNTFTNMNKIPITIDPVIINDSLNEFVITDTTPIIVDSLESVDITVLFQPKSKGQKSAKIKWQPDLECKQSETKISGMGLETEIAIPSIDWKLRRVNSINDTVVYLHNNNNFPVIIDSMIFESNGIFNLKYNITGEKIKANDSIGISINFIPEEERDYYSFIKIYINSNKIPYIIHLNGEGGIPQIDLTYNCGEEILVNTKSHFDLTVANKSSKMPLNIYDIHFPTESSSFKIISSIPEQISTQSNRNLLIEFSPTKSGKITDTIMIVSDACPQKYPLSIDTMYYAISCYSFDFDKLKEIKFDTVFNCKADTQRFSITNNSLYSDLIIYDYNINQLNDLFEVLNQFPITISPGDSVNILVKFKSNEPGNYKSTILLNTNWDSTITCNLEATSINFKIDPEYQQYIFNIGIDTALIFDLSIPDNNSLDLNDLDIYIYNNYNSIVLNIDKITSSQDNWKWELVDYNKEYIHLKGNGILDNNFIKGFLNIPIFTILGDSSGYMTLKYGFDDCIINDSIITKISLNEICFSNGRRVLISGSNDILAISPNPFEKTIKLTLTLPLNSKFSIKITDLLGRVKYFEKIQNNEIRHFNHKLYLNDLQPGIYFLIIEMEKDIIIEKIIKIYE